MIYVICQLDLEAALQDVDLSESQQKEIVQKLCVKENYSLSSISGLDIRMELESKNIEVSDEEWDSIIRLIEKELEYNNGLSDIMSDAIQEIIPENRR